MTTLIEVGFLNAAQATILAVGVWLITRVWRNPAVVQLLWVLVLLKLLFPPIVAVPWPMATFDMAPLGDALETDNIVSLPLSYETTADDKPVVSMSAPDAPIVRGVPTNFGDSVIQRSDVAPRANNHGRLTSRSKGSASNRWFDGRVLVMVIWLTGSIIYGSVALRRLIRFHRGLRCTDVADDQVQRWADDVAVRLGRVRTTQLRLTDAQLAPLVWPLGRPVILLSRSLIQQLSPEEAQALLAHELAHLRRRDHWVRWLEIVVTTIYWWHPVVWLARHLIQAAEEEACDALVVSVFPDRARQYAAALLKAMDFISEPRVSAPILASRLTPGRHFQERIEQIMNHNSVYRISMPIRFAVLLVAIAVLPVSISIVQADDEKSSSSSDSASDVAVDQKSSTAGVAAASDTVVEDSAVAGEPNATDPTKDPFSQSAGETGDQRTVRGKRQEAEIERKLSTPVTLRFVDAPLSEVVAELGSQVDLDIHLDPLGLSREGIDVDTPVTIALNKEVSLASALNLILKPLRLRYMIQDEVLQITSGLTSQHRANEPWVIAPLDILHIEVIGVFADAPINGQFRVEPGGTVALGAHYGRIKVSGLTLEGAEEVITEHLKKIVESPQVQVTIGGWQGRTSDPITSRFTRAEFKFGLPTTARRDPQELEVLRDHIRFLEEQFHKLDARYRTGAAGTTLERRELAAYELARARAELAMAEQNRQETIARLEEATAHAEKALQSVQAAYEAGRVTHEVVLQAANNLSEVKRQLLRLRNLEETTVLPRSAAERQALIRAEDDTAAMAPYLSDNVAGVSMVQDMTSSNGSVGFLKEVVEANQKELERINKLHEAGTATAGELNRAKAELRLSKEQLRQVLRQMEYRKLLVELAELEYIGAKNAKLSSPGAISDIELKKLQLKVELARAKLREIAE